MRRSTVIALVLGIVLFGCGTTAYKTFTVSGESLKGVGVQFESVARIYKQGCDAKTFKATDCETFRQFGLEFKKQYPVAVDLWNSSRQAGDGKLEGMTREMIVRLSEELTRLAVIAYTTYGRQ